MTPYKRTCSAASQSQVEIWMFPAQFAQQTKTVATSSKHINSELLGNQIKKQSKVLLK